MNIDGLKDMFDAVIEAVRTLEENDKKLSDLLVKQSKMQVALAKSVCMLAGEIDKINKNEKEVLIKGMEFHKLIKNSHPFFTSSKTKIGVKDIKKQIIDNLKNHE